MSTSESSFTNTSPIQLHSALRYLASIGWRLLPVEQRGKKPLLKQWPQFASCDVRQLEQWAVEFPGCNWGVATGAVSAVFVLDIDGDAGKASIEALAAQGCTLPDTLTVETGKGWHVYFAVPAATHIQNSVSSLGAGLDIRGDGGYVLVPPSIHQSGRSYLFRASLDPVNPIASAPDWLLQRVVKQEASIPLPQPIGERREPTEHERAYAVKALASEVEKLAAMRKGQGRNAALNTAALHMGEIVAAGWVDRAAVEAALMDAAQRNGYILQDGKAEAWNTLQSGVNAGMKTPRPPIVDAPLAVDPNTFTHKIDAVPLPVKAATSKANTSVRKGAEIVVANGIKAQKTEWLWYKFLPLKRLAVLAGNGSAGKSSLTLKMAATVSTGGAWPDNTFSKQGRILIWTAEDLIEETVIPRLAAMGADLSKVDIIRAAIDEHDNRVPFNPATDIPTITNMLDAQSGVVLVIIDPLISTINGDLNQANITRSGLQSLVDLAQKSGACVIGITHFKKNSAGQYPPDRVLGSGAFTQLPRVVLGAVKSEDGNERVLAVIKGNIGSESLNTIAYSIQGKAITIDGIEFSEQDCSEIVWGGLLPGTAQEIFNRIESVDKFKDENPQGKIDLAKDWLKMQLANGAKVNTNELSERALAAGISATAYNKAKKELHVRSLPDGLGKPWVSSLPQSDSQSTN